jgi:hypothetical protein
VTDPAQVSAELRRLGLTDWSLIRYCSRAERCNVNLCPLDPLIALRWFDPGDRETKCPMPKPARERYVAAMPADMRALLPFGGLLETEWNRRRAARARMAAMTDEERTQFAERARARVLALNQARLSGLSKVTDTGADSRASQSGSSDNAQGEHQ